MLVATRLCCRTAAQKALLTVQSIQALILPGVDVFFVDLPSRKSAERARTTSATGRARSASRIATGVAAAEALVHMQKGLENQLKFFAGEHPDLAIIGLLYINAPSS